MKAIRALLLVAVMAVGGSAIALDLPPQLSGWSALFHGDDMKARGNDLAQMIFLTRAALLHLELQPKAEALTKQVSEELRSMDLDRLFEIFGEQGDRRKDRRFLGLSGRLDGQSYELEVASKKSLEGFGDFFAGLELQPRDDAYRMETSGLLRLEVLDAADVLYGLTQGLRWVEGELQPFPIPTERGVLDSADLARLRAFHDAAPRTAEVIEPLIIWHDLVAPAGGRGYLRADLQLNLEGLGKSYPALKRSFEGLKGLFDVRFRFADDQDRTLMSGRFDSTQLRLALSVVSRDGRIVPREDDALMLKDAIDLTTVEAISYNTQLEVDSKLAGVEFRVRDLRFEHDFSRSKDLAVWRSRLSQPPKINVEGAAFGVVPVWLVDALIPSNLQTIANEFFVRLARGNHGRGLRTELALPEARGDGNITAGAEAELKKNGFVAFGLGVSAWRSQSKDVAKSERMELRRKLLDAFTSDFERVRKQLSRAE